MSRKTRIVNCLGPFLGVKFRQLCLLGQRLDSAVSLEPSGGLLVRVDPRSWTRLFRLRRADHFHKFTRRNASKIDSGGRHAGSDNRFVSWGLKTIETRSSVMIFIPWSAVRPNARCQVSGIPFGRLLARGIPPVPQLFLKPWRLIATNPFRSILMVPFLSWLPHYRLVGPIAAF